MSCLSRPIRRIAGSAPVARSVAIASLMGAMALAGPLSPARADSAGHPATQLAQAAAPQSDAAAESTAVPSDTVEQRIASLHAQLEITPDETSKWSSVAQAMRENAAAMEARAAAKADQEPQSMNAVQDLKAYQAFLQGRIDGLKNLIMSFETLYDSMPDAQRLVADDVFRRFGHGRPPAQK